jgi:hypothetical protein
MLSDGSDTEGGVQLLASVPLDRAMYLNVVCSGSKPRIKAYAQRSRPQRRQLLALQHAERIAQRESVTNVVEEICGVEGDAHVVGSDPHTGEGVHVSALGDIECGADTEG